MILRLDVIANAANSGLTGSMCQLYDKWIAFFAVCMLQSVHGNAGRPFPTPARADERRSLPQPADQLYMPRVKEGDAALRPHLL